MRDQTYMKLINIIFVSVSFISFFYLIVIFNFTNFLNEEKVNTLIPIIITFFLGVGLKSLYTFFTFSLVKYNKEYEYSHDFIKSIIDFATAYTFLDYLGNIVENHYLRPIIYLVNISVILGTVLNQFLGYKAIKMKKELNRQKDIN
ncbi:hypothetical protein MKS61_00075 [Staphylococcus haemolyticus]|uniref:hypothetical protein n=1 Tax=Staphylococcus haemolyticus TaxID=1283 RepID=UPI001F0B0BE7|nr:hypothetical protein [Staphylococcus haemolyticus]MCH4531488.1 hypothetical protein [Staphylococcus haemolyticus]